MPEKRLFHTKINNPDSNKTDYEAFYEAHTVRDVRGDAGRRFMNSDRYKGRAFSVDHETLTKDPTEFYKRIGEAEKQATVKHEKVPGLGRRWEVQKEEDDSPFGKAADDNGGVPPSLQGEEFGPEDPPVYYETLSDLLPEEDDRVGLPDDQDDYEAEPDNETKSKMPNWNWVEDMDYENQEPLSDEDRRERQEVLDELEKKYPINMGIAPSPMYDPNNIDPKELSGDQGDMIAIGGHPIGKGVSDDKSEVIAYESSPHPNFPRGVDYDHIDPLQKLPESEPYYERPYTRNHGYDAGFRARPQFYNGAAIIASDNPVEEMTRQDKEYATGTPEERRKYEAVGGYYVPLEDATEPKVDGVTEESVPTPTPEELEATLEKLRRDPSSYYEPELEEAKTQGSRGGYVGCYFI